MGKTVPVPLEEVAGKLKMVDPKDPLIQEIKDMGICLETACKKWTEIVTQRPVLMRCP